MLLFEGGLAIVAFAVWVFCIIDVITTPNGQARNLPKLMWLFLVVVLIDIGSIVWLVAGRPWQAKALAGARTASRPSNPDDDEEFLAGLRLRAEEQRRRAAREDDPPTA